jgi:hypothetical protein
MDEGHELVGPDLQLAGLHKAQIPTASLKSRYLRVVHL